MHIEKFSTSFDFLLAKLSTTNKQTKKLPLRPFSLKRKNLNHTIHNIQEQESELLVH